MERTDGRNLSREALDERRRRAVKLRLSGMKLAAVSEVVELSFGTIISAVKAYKTGGWAAVATRRRGRSEGDGRTLSAEQERAMRKLICDRTPDQLKLPYALWPLSAVGALIAHQVGLKLPVRTVGHYLKRWGFTPQKPIRKAYEQRPTAVKKWLEEEYPAIAQRGKAEGAEIQW